MEPYLDGNCWIIKAGQGERVSEENWIWDPSHCEKWWMANQGFWALPEVWLIYLTVLLLYLSCSLSCSWWSHQDSKNHKKELFASHTKLLLPSVVNPWTLFAPGSQGAGILLITKAAFLLVYQIPSLPSMQYIVPSLLSPSMFLHCFILYSILKILFDSVSLQQLPHFFVLWNKSSQKSCLYQFYNFNTYSSWKFLFFIRNKFYFLVIKFPSLRQK